jgi:hypothetical protein
MQDYFKKKSPKKQLPTGAVANFVTVPEFPLNDENAMLERRMNTA